MPSDQRKFPSGRTVDNCKKDAKNLTKERGISHAEALDLVAQANGIDAHWHQALQQLGEQPAPVPPFPVMTVTDIQAVMKRVPYLTHFGLGLYRGVPRTPAEYRREMQENRDMLLDALDECNKACRFLAFTEKRKTINRRMSSYGLKHQVEGFVRQFPEVKNPYVANGSFICAALHLGFEFQPTHFDSPNAFFNISSRSPVMEWRKLSELGSAFISKRKREKLEALRSRLGLA